jgi:hypothetical protein
MTSQVGMTLGICQALYYEPIALPQPNPTTFSQGSARALHCLMTFLYSFASVGKVMIPLHGVG